MSIVIAKLHISMMVSLLLLVNMLPMTLVTLLLLVVCLPISLQESST